MDTTLQMAISVRVGKVHYKDGTVSIGGITLNSAKPPGFGDGARDQVQLIEIDGADPPGIQVDNPAAISGSTFAIVKTKFVDDASFSRP